MGNVSLYFWESCIVEPMEMDPEVFTITPLVRTGPYAWAESGEPGIKARHDRGEPVSNLPLSVAVEKKLPEAEGGTDEDGRNANGRMVVWGSVISLTNPVMKFSDLQIDYAVNQFRWLLDREPRGGGIPQIITPVEATQKELTRIRWVTHAGFPGLAVAIGILVWFLRRK